MSLLWISQTDLYVLEGGLILAMLEFGIILYILWKTPAIQFIFPMRGILYHPQTNRLADFKRIKKLDGCLATTKDDMIYQTRPQDFYVERKSKAPIAIVYAGNAGTTNPREAAMAQKLKEAGINNFDELEEKVKKCKSGKRITQKQKKKASQ